MKSPITGKEMSLVRKKGELTFRKEVFQYVNHFYKCADSGEEFSSTELDELNLAQVYNQYRDKYNLPFPSEIRNIRSKYKLSASKMAEILGFGTNSYRNYENAEVPSNSNGRLIQLINDPVKFKDIVELCGSLKEGEKEKILIRINALIFDSQQNAFLEDMELYLLGSQLPDSLTGYVKPSLAKLTQMVKYFAERIEPWKTVMNKLLFYSDFLAYRNSCYSMSGVRYRAIKMGPVPNNYNSIYEYMSNKNQVDVVNVEFSNDRFGYQFKKLMNQEFKAELFTSDEVEVLELVSTHFSKMNTSQIVELSHNETAWIENEQEKNLIDYNYAFDMKQL